MKLIDFIECSNDARNLYELIQLYSSALEPYGYDKFVCFTTQGPLIDIASPVDGKLHYMKTLVDTYDRHHYLAVDPIYQLFMSARRPFTWDQVWRLPLSNAQKSAMDLRREKGLRKGFSIPLMNYDQELIGITVASTKDDARMDADALAYIYALTNQYRLRRAEMLNQSALPLAPFKMAGHKAVPQTPFTA